MNISKFDNGQSSLILDRASSQLDEKVHPQSPVFIVGIMERSGTNYLADVLLIDASFAMPTILNEDFVMEHAHLLLEYVDGTYGRWKQLKWIENPGAHKKLLLRHLGEGILVGFLGWKLQKTSVFSPRLPEHMTLTSFFICFPTQSC